MSPLLGVVLGLPGTGKTERLLRRYGECLLDSSGSTARGPSPLPCLWLSPTFRAAEEVRGRLVGLGGGCFRPGVMTFGQFAEHLLATAPEAVRPISPRMKRHLVRRLLTQNGSDFVSVKLAYFGQIAGTSGLVDLVCELLGELKRLEIWPEQLAAAMAAEKGDSPHLPQSPVSLPSLAQKGTVPFFRSPRDEDLLAIYQGYQAALREHGLYDAEGRFWSARDWLRKSVAAEKGDSPHLPEGPGGCCAQMGTVPFFRWRLVVADGFHDFTRTQHEILETLAGRADELWISLPLEPEPRRRDLFQRSLATLAELTRRHPGLRIEETACPGPPAWPAMDCLRRTLFGNMAGLADHAYMVPVDTPYPSGRNVGWVERSEPHHGNHPCIEILAAGRRLGEIELIGARIKRLLLEGDDQGRPVRPGQIAVVFRHPQEAGALVGEVFDRLGIPLAAESPSAPGCSPSLVTFLRLLRPEADGDVPAEWITALEALPHRATLAGWIGALRRLAERTAASKGDSPVFADHRSAMVPAKTGTVPDVAWEQFWEGLDECRRLDGWLGAEELDRAEATAVAQDLVASQTVSAGGDEAGRVRVLSAATARHLRIPYLFVAGLDERSFPRPDRDERLLRQSERGQLIEQGLPLPSRADRQGDEMLLFYETLTAATRRLWLSYPSIDERGDPLLPSPYLQELEEALGEKGDCPLRPESLESRAAQTGTVPFFRGLVVRTERLDLSPLPQGEPLSPGAFRLAAVAAAMGGDGELLAGLVGQGTSAAAGVLSGLEILARRQDRRQFGPAEGMLGPAAAVLLAQEFSAERTYSVTELESYAYCPFRFFVERQMKIEPIEDAMLRVDYRQRGLLLHDFLAELHRRLNREHGGPTSPAALDEEQFRRLAEEVLDSLPELMATGAGKGDRSMFSDQVVRANRAEWPKNGPVPHPVRDALARIDRRVVRQWSDDYRRQHERYDDLWRDCEEPLRPEFFEVAFGRELRGNEGPPSTAAPWEMPAGQERIRLAGRIDRIDTGRAGGRSVLNILDYKSGASKRFSPEAALRGIALQLPLYAQAAAELLLQGQDALPWQAGYWYVAADGFKPKQALVMHQPGDRGPEPTPEWEELRGQLGQVVAALVRGMREGQFRVWSADPDCTGSCPFHTVCRIQQVRSQEKTWQPLP